MSIMCRINYKLLFLFCVFLSSCKQIYVFKQDDYLVDKYEYNEIKKLGSRFAMDYNLKNDTINILKEGNLFHRNYYVIKDTIIYNVKTVNNNFTFEQYTEKGIIKDIVTNGFIIPVSYLIDANDCSECSSVSNYMIKVKNNQKVVILKGKLLNEDYYIL